MTATQGQTIKQLASVDLPSSLAALQRWRNADHEDTIRLTRDDVVTLIEETRAQLADAQAAQAMVVERAAAKADRGHGTYCRARGRDPEKYVSAFYLMAREIRALAPIDGLALVREMRAEMDTLRVLCEDRFNEIARLAAANAAFEAKVAGLHRDALIRDAEARGMERAAELALSCGIAVNANQRDAIAAAIRAAKATP